MEVKRETFDNVVQVRVGDKLLSDIDDLMQRKPDVWASRSHFFRAGAIKLLREK